VKIKILVGAVIVVAIGMVFPGNLKMPVEKADRRSYHPESFWYYPWGRSGTHKGVDIFAKRGTPVNASCGGLVIYSGDISVGGKVVLILGAKWRVHYYAHLDALRTSSFRFVEAGENIGALGDSGNAKGKQPHLHYSIATLIPYLWNIDNSPQGWKKMFYINPIPLLK
jgi:peptidoglycan LD-endopeptidase LytH